MLGEGSFLNGFSDRKN